MLLDSIRTILIDSLSQIDGLILDMESDSVTDKLILDYELKREHSRGIRCLQCRGL